MKFRNLGKAITAAAIALAAMAVVWIVRARRPADKLGFNDDIRPILAENCFQCHGPDPGARKGELRLDDPKFAFLPRKNGVTIVRGDPDASLLVRRIESKNPREAMPPAEAHKTLQPGEIAILRRWIKEGAGYQEHWAFIPPVKPELPRTARRDWGHNEIDRFILAGLEKAGLAPSAEADKYTLLRRVTFDLTGLPPSLEEVGAFLDDSSPGAYERVVDRLLASPQYGEHRAHYWLDAVRYADTHGAHYDDYRNSWPYRDYVIRAFNQNKPFDRFAIEQLAGDLLPPENVDQLVATGFERAHITSNEGGAILEELQFNKVKDRADTVGEIFLGLTVGCATCHDHKFDPITQKDYYSFNAFFNNTADYPFDSNDPAPYPTVAIPPPEKIEEANRALRAEAVAERGLQARKDRAPSLIHDWLAGGGAQRLRSVSTDRLAARFRFDEGRGTKVSNSAPGADPVSYDLGGGQVWDDSVKYWTTLRFDIKTKLEAPRLGDFDRSEAFTVGGWFLAREDSASRSGALVSRMSVGAPGPGEDAEPADEAETAAKPGMSSAGPRGWDLYWEDATTTPAGYRRDRLGRLAVHLFHARDDGIVVRTVRIIGRREWFHAAFSYDGSGRASGVKIYLNGEPQAVEVMEDDLSGGIRTEAPFQVGCRTGGSRLAETSFQDLRLYGRRLDPAEVGCLTNEDIVREIALRPETAWNEDQRKAVTDFFFTHVDAPSIALAAEQARWDLRFREAAAGGAMTLVARERDALPISHVLDRGVYSAYKERVRADVPRVLPPLSADEPHNRLGLAEWLVSPRNPLTARVTVNRMWQEVFGTGLVDTPQDFGTMGDRPSNPALLDWLAVDFREHGWDVKRFYKQVVMSDTYRQSAQVTADRMEKDPGNRLLARGPRFRLDAEMIRDQALAASGLLVEQIGGPGVNSYQPPGIWEAVALDRSNTRDYQQDSGAALFRRSIYLFWKRSAPSALMTTFDAPQRDACTLRRERTDTPLQALAAENAPDFLEAARHLAARAMQTSNTGNDRKVDWMARLVLTKPLAPPERRVLLDSYEGFYRCFSNEADAKLFLSVGDSPVDASLPPREFAAWTMVASQLLNTDQALSK